MPRGGIAQAVALPRGCLRFPGTPKCVTVTQN